MKKHLAAISRENHEGIARAHTVQPLRPAQTIVAPCFYLSDWKCLVLDVLVKDDGWQY